MMELNKHRSLRNCHPPKKKLRKVNSQYGIVKREVRYPHWVSDAIILFSVASLQINADKCQNDPLLKEIYDREGYSYQDQVEGSSDAPTYEKMVKRTDLFKAFHD